MKRFFVELIGGVALLAAGIVLSASNTRVVFIGLIAAGAVGVGAAFVDLYKYKKTGAARFVVRRVAPADRPRELEAFLATCAEQPPLEKRKEISFSCERDMEGPVRLNGEEVGRLKKNAYFEFTAERLNNVLTVSDAPDGILFFHVASTSGRGRIAVGAQSLALDETTGIAEGLALGEREKSAPGAKKKKLKKAVMIALGVVVALALALLGLSLYKEYRSRAENRKWSALYDSIANLDVENAERAAREIRDNEVALERVERLRGFVEAVDAGDWQGALDVWGSEAGGSFYGTGRALATYYDCRYKLLEPKLDAALASKRYADAWTLAGDFYRSIYPSGVHSDSHKLNGFTECFPEDAQRWREAFDVAGAALFAAEDYKAVDPFLKLYKGEEQDARRDRFGEFSWYEAAEARWSHL